LACDTTDIRTIEYFIYKLSVNNALNMNYDCPVLTIITYHCLSSTILLITCCIVL